MAKFIDFISDFVYFVLALLLYIILTMVRFMPYIITAVIFIVVVKMIVGF